MEEVTNERKVQFKELTEKRVYNPKINVTEGSPQLSLEPLVEEDPNKRKLTSTLNDGGYGYTILAVCCALQFLLGGIIYSYPTYLSHMLRAINEEQVDVFPLLILTGGLSYGLGEVFYPFGGFLASRFGYRLIVCCGITLVAAGLALASLCTEAYQLILTQGFLVGLGAGIANYPITDALLQWFHQSRELVTILLYVSNSLGAISLNFMAKSLISTSNVASSLRLQAILILFLANLAALFLNQRYHNPPKSHAFDFKRFKDPKFTSLLIGVALASLGFFTSVMILPHLGTFSDDSDSYHSLIVSISSGLGLSALVFGLLSYYLGPVNITILSLLLSPIFLLSFLSQPSYAVSNFLALFYSTCSSSINHLIFIITGHQYTVQGSVQPLGMILVFKGLASIVGSVFIAFPMQITHTTEGKVWGLPVILIPTVAFLLSAVVLLFYRRLMNSNLKALI